jgi:hypothetical protein
MLVRLNKVNIFSHWEGLRVYLFDIVLIWLVSIGNSYMVSAMFDLAMVGAIPNAVLRTCQNGVERLILHPVVVRC